MATATPARSHLLSTTREPLVLEATSRRLQLPPLVLQGGQYTLGSDPECDLVVAVPGIQPRHCVLDCTENRPTVRAESSRTWLNNFPTIESQLKDGDRLAIGPVEFRIRRLSPDETWSTGEPAQSRIAYETQPTLRLDQTSDSQASSQQTVESSLLREQIAQLEAHIARHEQALRRHDVQGSGLQQPLMMVHSPSPTPEPMSSAVHRLLQVPLVPQLQQPDPRLNEREAALTQREAQLAQQIAEFATREADFYQQQQRMQHEQALFQRQQRAQRIAQQHLQDRDAESLRTSEKLAEERTQLDLQWQQLTAAAQRLEHDQAQCDTLRHDISIWKSEFDHQTAQLDQQQSDVQQHLTQLEQERARIAQQQEGLEASRAQLQIQVDEHQSRAADLEDRLAEFEQSTRAWHELRVTREAQFAAQTQELDEARAELQQREQSCEARWTALDLRVEELETAREQLSQDQAEVVQSRAELARQQRSQATLQAELQSRELHQRNLQQALDAQQQHQAREAVRFQEARADFQNSIAEWNQTRIDQAAQSAVERAELHQLRTALEQLQSELEDRASRLTVETDLLSAKQESLAVEYEQLQVERDGVVATQQELDCAQRQFSAERQQFSDQISSERHALEAVSAEQQTQAEQLARARSLLEHDLQQFDVSRQRLEQEWSTLEAERLQVIETRAELAETRVDLEQQRSDFLVETRLLTSERARLLAEQDQLREVRREQAAQQQQLSEQQTELNRALAELTRLEEELAALETDLAQVESSLTAREIEIAWSERELELSQPQAGTGLMPPRDDFSSASAVTEPGVSAFDALACAYDELTQTRSEQMQQALIKDWQALSHERDLLRYQQAQLFREKQELSRWETELKAEQARLAQRLEELVEQQHTLVQEQTMAWEAAGISYNRETQSLAGQSAHLQLLRTDLEQRQAAFTKEQAVFERQTAAFERTRVALEQAHQADVEELQATWDSVRLKLAQETQQLEEDLDAVRLQQTLLAEKLQLFNLDQAQLQSDQQWLRDEAGRLQEWRQELARSFAATEEARQGCEQEHYTRWEFWNGRLADQQRQLEEQCDVLHSRWLEIQQKEQALAARSAELDLIAIPVSRVGAVTPVAEVSPVETPVTTNACSVTPAEAQIACEWRSRLQQLVEEPLDEAPQVPQQSAALNQLLDDFDYEAQTVAIPESPAEPAALTPEFIADEEKFAEDQPVTHHAWSGIQIGGGELIREDDDESPESAPASVAAAPVAPEPEADAESELRQRLKAMFNLGASQASSRVEEETATESTTPEPVASTTAAMSSTPVEEPQPEDDSIAAYMSRLLARHRTRDDDEPEVAPVSRKQPEPEAEQDRPEETAPEESSTTDEPAEVVPLESRPRPDRKQIRDSLDSLREVANLSARSALADYNWRKLRAQMGLKFVLAVASLAIGLVILAGQMMHLQVSAGLGWMAICITIFMGWDLARNYQFIHRHEPRRGRITLPVRPADPQQPEPPAAETSEEAQAENAEAEKTQDG